MTTPITPEQARETADDMYFADECEWPPRARKTILNLVDQVEVLTAERNALKADAARYRWLRDQAGNEILDELSEIVISDKWDAAIDAAMAVQP